MMEFIKQPMAIEHRSMELIAPYLAGLSLSEAEKKVYSRIIHAAGDVEYAPIIRISETAVAAGIAALRGGADIYTDVEMVRTGINKRKLTSFGGTVHCRIADPEIAARAKAEGVTRSLMAMRSFGGLARTGAALSHGSGDYALAFSTALDVRRTPQRRTAAATRCELPNDLVSPLFLAAIEATEEAILNSLCMATTLTGYRGTIEALPLDRVAELAARLSSP